MPPPPGSESGGVKFHYSPPPPTGCATELTLTRLNIQHEAEASWVDCNKSTRLNGFCFCNSVVRTFQPPKPQLPTATWRTPSTRRHCPSDHRTERTAAKYHEQGSGPTRVSIRDFFRFIDASGSTIFFFLLEKMMSTNITSMMIVPENESIFRRHSVGVSLLIFEAGWGGANSGDPIYLPQFLFSLEFRPLDLNKIIWKTNHESKKAGKCCFWLGHTPKSLDCWGRIHAPPAFISHDIQR